VLPTKLPLREFYTQVSRLHRETGWWGPQHSQPGATTTNDAAKRGTRMLLRDLREGWTDLPAVERHARRIGVLVDEKVHLAKLEQSELHRVMAASA
jgi:hypothetical protein